MASIPLSFTPPNIQNPIDQYGKAVQLKSMIQQQQYQQQMQPLQLRAAQIQNQEQELALNDQKIGSQAYKDASGDPETFLQKAAAAGMTPKSLFGYRQVFTQQAQQLANLDKTKRETLELKHGEASAELQGVMAIQDSQERAQAWRDTSAKLLRQNTLNPGEIPTEYPGDGPAGLTLMHLNTAKGLLEQAKATSLENEQKARAARENASAQQTNQNMLDKQQSSIASQLATATDKYDFLRKLDQINANQQGGLPQVPTTDTLFDPATGKWTPTGKPTMLAWGQNAEQQRQSMNQDVTRAQGDQRIALETKRVGLQGRMVGIAQQNADANTSRANRETAASRTQAVKDGAEKVVNDSIAQGGTSPDDFIRNAQQFYQGDEDIEPYRQEIVDYLSNAKKTGALATTAVNKAKGKGGWRDRLNGGSGTPAPAPAKTPAASAPAKTPAAPAAAPGASAKPAAHAQSPKPDDPLTVKLPNGRYIHGTRAQLEKFAKDANLTLK